ncbi:mucin-3A-like [Hyla sarda]|uniref:mucin-3A-like n=1 Tax=Hyla sarda TaxID=327740 RepID=UPI0024C31373|nr:mucin-3A-like [Hyla sarda]
MEATLTLNYTGNQTDFEMEYNAMMELILNETNGYHKLTSYRFGNDLVTATSDVFVTIEYNNTLEVSEQYEEKYYEVVAAFNKNKCKSQDLCIKIPTIQAVRPPSKYDRCAEKVSSMYLQFFDPVVSINGMLACVSRCVPSSPNFLNCNDGNCQIRGEEGPQCFCPRTDIYLYTYPRCGGAVSIAALYGGVGASIGLLVIVGVVLGVVLYRRKYY